MHTKLEIQHLQMIKEIIETGSVTIASKRLHISQSALSHRIKEAERRIGCKIFIKNGKKLCLTKAGERLHFSAQSILKELLNAEYAISTLTGLDESMIRIGIRPYGCCEWFPALLEQTNLKKISNGLNVSLEIVKNPLDKLAEEEIDIAILSYKTDNSSFSYIKLFEDELIAVVPRNHPKAGKAFLKPSDFNGEIYFAHEAGPEKGREYDRFFSRQALKLEKVVTVGMTEMIITLVTQEKGLTILSRRIARPYLLDGKLTGIPLTKKGISIEWFAATRTKFDQSKSTAVVKIIRDIGNQES